MYVATRTDEKRRRGTDRFCNRLRYARSLKTYSPSLGRFLQADPIGYEGDGSNLYAYVLNDPVNSVDPLGLVCNFNGGADDDILVCGHRHAREGSPLPPNVQGAGNPNGSVRGGGGAGVGQKQRPKPKPKPKADKSRSMCAAAVTGAGVYGLLGGGSEAVLLGTTLGEVAAGGLAVAAAPALVLGGIVVGAVTVVAVGTYYYDQSNQNAAANSLAKSFRGLCG